MNAALLISVETYNALGISVSPRVRLTLNWSKKMDSKDYQINATATDLMDYGPVFDRLQQLHTVRLLHAAMGLCTESGEFMDMLKKHILYGKPIDAPNLKEELGDLEWYIALAIEELNTTFGIIFETNIAKLRARYPNKFTEQDALNRNLNKERQILEEPRTGAGSLD